MLKPKYIIFLILLIFSKTTESQNIKDTLLISEVSVSAEKKISQICLNFITLDTLVLQKNINLNLSDLLSNHTSIFIKNYGSSSISTASFRGTAASHTQVLWNDVNINSPNSGQIDFSQIPVFLIDGIEIFYGSSSLSQTTGALGGSISLENNPDWTTDFKLKTILSYGSFQTYNGLTDFGFGNRKIRTRSRIYFEKSKNDFEFTNNAIPNEELQNQENAEFKKEGIFQEIYFRLTEKTLLSLNIWQQFSNRNIPHIMSFSGFSRTEFQKDNDLKINFSIKKVTKKVKVKLTTSFSNNKLNYYLGDSIFIFGKDNLFFEKVNSTSLSNSISNIFLFDYKFSDELEIQTKINSNFHKIKSDDFVKTNVESNNSQRLETGFFVGIYKRNSKKLTSYFSNNSIIYNKKVITLIPAIGFDYKPVLSKDFHLKSNISKNYRIPSLNDLYWIPGGNSDLQPETGYSADFSISFLNNIEATEFEIETSFFSSYINNWIVWQPSEFQYWTAQNLNTVFCFGSEISIKIKGNIGKTDFQLFSNYSFTSTKNISENKTFFSKYNKQLLYIPKNIFNSFISLNRKKIEFKVTYLFTDKRFTSISSENKNYLPSYSILNISSSRSFIISDFKINLIFGIDNLLNSQYQSILYRAMPGRNYNLTVQFLMN